MSEIVYLNGSLIPRSQAKVSALDYGFLYGFGLFETMRAYEGQVFRLESHLSRLARSAELLGLPVKTPELKDAVRDTIKANRLSNARIRITISAGEGKIPPDHGACQKPTVLVLAERYQPHPQGVYQRGFRAVISSIRRNSQAPLSRLKSTNYLESLLARQQARETGVDEAVCLRETGGSQQETPCGIPKTGTHRLNLIKELIQLVVLSLLCFNLWHGKAREQYRPRC